MVNHSDYKTQLSSIEPSDDIVEYTLQCVRALSPQTPPDLTDAILMHMVQLFGGQSVYINFKRSRDCRNEAIRHDHQQGAHVNLLMRRYGLSRATIIRIINLG